MRVAGRRNARIQVAPDTGPGGLADVLFLPLRQDRFVLGTFPVPRSRGLLVNLARLDGRCAG